MSDASAGNPFVGSWSYRSFFNDPDLSHTPTEIELGEGTIVIEPVNPPTLKGTIGGPGWSLDLYGYVSFGSPMETRFQGTGIVGGNQWIYAYVGWLVPIWPNSNPTLQRPAIVGSVTRVIPHPSSGGGVSPAGVVGSFFAVRQD